MVQRHSFLIALLGNGHPWTEMVKFFIEKVSFELGKSSRKIFTSWWNVVILIDKFRYKIYDFVEVFWSPLNGIL